MLSLIFIYSLITYDFEKNLFVFGGMSFCIFVPRFCLHFKNGGLITDYKLFDAIVGRKSFIYNLKIQQNHKLDNWIL